MELLENFSPVTFYESVSSEVSEIHERALIRARKYLVAEAALLEAIMEVDRHRVFECFGFTHLTPYCVKKLGLSEEVAASFVRVARKSKEVPVLKEAVDSGLSISKAKAIVSVVTEYNAKEWIDKATALPRDKLEKEIAKVAPQKVKKEKLKPTAENRIRVEFELTEEEMEWFQRARDLVCQKSGKPASLADTQRELLKEFLKRQDPVEKAKRAHRPRGRSGVEHQVHLRDRGECQAILPSGEKCRSRKWIHIHHVKPRCEGGLDTLENLLTLCASHHRLWHKRQDQRERSF